MIEYKCDNCGEPMQSPENLAYDVCLNCDQQNKVPQRKIHWINKYLVGIAVFFILIIVAQSSPVIAIFLVVMGVISIFCCMATIRKNYTELQLLVVVTILVALFFWLAVDVNATYYKKITVCLICGIISICYLLGLIVLKLQKLIEK